MRMTKKVKTVGIVKKIDWHLLTRELLDGLFLSQQDLAERCRNPHRQLPVYDELPQCL